MTTWKRWPVADNGEPLVAMGPFSDFPQLAGSAIYFGERRDSPYPTGGPGTLLTHFAGAGVVERLARVASSLPDTQVLWLWDTYRSEDTQRTLYDWFEREVTARFALEGDELSVYVQRYVSMPSVDPQKPSPHLTGGAIDLTIAEVSARDAQVRRAILDELHELEAGRPLVDDAATDYNWQRAYDLHMQLADLHRSAAVPLDMGTAFDEMTDLAHADYFAVPRPEIPDQAQIQRNRSLLRNAMEAVGFTQYDDEWWHYNFGNQMWAEANGAPAAIYGPAFLSAENRTFEQIRRAHDARQRAWHEGRDVSSAGTLDSPYRDFARVIARDFSAPHHAIQPPAASLTDGL
ncbi:MAG: M15 family metallopeptidase [Acidimicrobiia bacterium]